MRKLFIFLILIIPVAAKSDLVVIVNLHNKLTEIEPAVLQDIYMGRLRAFKDGSLALPIDQAKSRAEFYEKLTKRPIEQINAYWARIIFSGEASPPRIMPDDASVVMTVKENPGAIGYVSPESLSNDVKKILILK